ncbi:MAG: hypothetical protein IJE08_11250 [Clostridia bacterium]|nr:hypothetical protein [Clostridia bacterium]
MNETITPGSELLKRTERSMEEIMNKKDAKRVSAKMALALALAGVLALTGVAFATGAVESLFGWFRDWGYSTTADIDQLNELADSGFEAESQSTQYNGNVSAELVQAYYDGYQLIIGARYQEGASKVILGLEHDALAMTRPDDPAFCATKHEPGGVYINDDGQIPEKSKLLPPYIIQWMTDEQIAAFEKMYAENGEAGVVLYTAGASDHIAVEGDDQNRLVPEDDHQNMQENGVMLRYVDFGDLIEECRDKEQLTVTLLMGEGVSAVRTDKDGIWVAGQPLGQLEFPYVVRKNEQDTTMLYGSYENDVYSAKAEVRVSDVSTRVIVDVTQPAEWLEARSDPKQWKTVEFIRMLYVVQPDGSMVSFDGMPTENGAYRWETALDLIEGQEEIRIRPYYSISGYQESEDIVISLENGISSVK